MINLGIGNIVSEIKYEKLRDVKLKAKEEQQ